MDQSFILAALFLEDPPAALERQVAKFIDYL